MKLVVQGKLTQLGDLAGSDETESAGLLVEADGGLQVLVLGLDREVVQAWAERLYGQVKVTVEEHEHGE